MDNRKRIRLTDNEYHMMEVISNMEPSNKIQRKIREAMKK